MALIFGPIVKALSVSSRPILLDSSGMGFSLGSGRKYEEGSPVEIAFLLSLSPRDSLRAA
jgi:hypothetical protein